MNRILELVDGFRDSLRFSNPIELVWNRILSRRSPVAHYEWRGRWHLYCETAVCDHYSAKELLAHGVYDRYIQESQMEGICSYVNIGANIGAFDVAIQALGMSVPYALSIELNPRTFSKLNFNLEINGFGSVRRLNAGIAGKSGTHRFSPRTNSLTDGLYSAEPAQDGAIDVPIFSLRDCLRATGLEGRHFNLLKIDCEGSEYDIIETVDEEVIALFDHLVMELHSPPSGRTSERLYSKLATCGFRSGAAMWIESQPAELRFWSRLK